MQQHEHRLAQLQERVLMRWAFEQWKSCKMVKRLFFVLSKSFVDINNLADEQRMMHMAEEYSDRRIMVRKKRLLPLIWIGIGKTMVQLVFFV